MLSKIGYYNNSGTYNIYQNVSRSRNRESPQVLKSMYGKLKSDIQLFDLDQSQLCLVLDQSYLYTIHIAIHFELSG